MKHIAVIVPEGNNNLSSIVGSYKILHRANARWQEKRKEAGYVIELVGCSERTDFHGGLFSVNPQRLIGQCQKTDLIILPLLNHQFEEDIRKNGELIDWIRLQYKKGAEIASICTGSFLLAATGLLKGRGRSTHWAFADIFRNNFPDVKIESDKLITEEHGIYTNGGAYSFLNLLIYLVEKYFDRETAIHCAKIFQIEVDRFSQSPFIMFSGLKTHEDEEIRKAQIYMEENVPEKISIQELSCKLALGRRNFDRRFAKATGLSPVEYMQRVKIEVAKKALESTRKNVTEVMYEVGYYDPKAFRTIFRRVTGMTPLAYRARFNRDTAL